MLRHGSDGSNQRSQPEGSDQILYHKVEEEVREAALKEAEQAMKEEKETAVLEAKADGKTEETK